MMRATSLLLLYFVIGEVLARFFLNSPGTTIPDEELGWIWRPGAEIFHTKEGWGRNRINRFGLNDIEPSQHQYKKNILILGDSFTEALQVQQSANFVSLTEQALRCANIMNAGRSDMALMHFPAMAKRLASKTKISHIVVVLNNWDLADTLSNSDALVYGNSDQIVDIEPGFGPPHILRQKADFLFRNSALAYYLLERAKTIKAMSAMAEPISEVAANDIVQKSTDVQAFTKIAAFVFSELESIAPVSILYIPKLAFDHDGVSRATKNSAIFEDALRELASIHTIDFLSSKIWLQSSYMQYRVPPVGFQNARLFQGHLNHSGHNAVGKALTKLLVNVCHSSKE